MSSPLTKQPNGQVTWTHQEGDKYVVTGLYYNTTRRFRQIYSSWNIARCINLWRGKRWLLRDGRRYLIQSVTN